MENDSLFAQLESAKQLLDELRAGKEGEQCERRCMAIEEVSAAFSTAVINYSIYKFSLNCENSDFYSDEK